MRSPEFVGAAVVGAVVGAAVGISHVSATRASNDDSGVTLAVHFRGRQFGRATWYCSVRLPKEQREHWHSMHAQTAVHT